MFNYRNQNSCNNCKWRFTSDDWDEATSHYCNAAGDRPSWRREVVYDQKRSIEEWEGECEAVWDAWADKHLIAPNGICDKFEEIV